MKILTLAVSVLCTLALVAVPAFAQIHEDGRCECREIPKAHFKKDHGRRDAPPKKGEGGQDAPRKKEGPQDGGDAKKPPAKEGGGDQKAHKCGKSAAGIHEEWVKRKDVNAKDLENNIKDHFKQHPDGVCHCLCGHKEGDGGIKKEGGGDAPHPVKKEGPAGPPKIKVKKCACEHAHDGECKKEGGDAPPPAKKEGGGDGDGAPKPKKVGPSGEGKDKEKANNGVGNGQDPQPPGIPKENDGAGAGPGRPGSKK